MITRKMITSFFNKIFITDSSFMVFLTICFIVLSIFCYNNNSFATQSEDSNNRNEFNIITAADFGCSLRAQENIKNIEKMNPELVLDTQLELSVDTLQSSAVINETLPAISPVEGNLTEEAEEHKKKNPLLKRYPTLDIKDFIEKNSINVKVPALEDLEEINAKVPDLEVDQEQYQFVLDDLEKTNENKNIDWIFVMFHKPMYSSISKQLEEYIIREKYEEIFGRYNVDLVIQGHNHIYSRTLPLSVNKQQISEPIIDQNNANGNNNSIFRNPNGIIYLVVGTGGDELYTITEKPYYVQNQYDKGFGFVDLKIEGKRLDGTFYDINLDCKMELREIKKSEVLDLDSCRPPLVGNDQLKVIDQFTIIK